MASTTPVSEWQSARFSRYDDEVHCIAFSPDGSLRLVLSGTKTGDIEVWDPLRVVHLSTLPGVCKAPVKIGIWSSAGDRLVSVEEEDGTLCLWDMICYKPLILVQNTNAHPSPRMGAMSFSPDSKYLMYRVNASIGILDVTSASRHNHAPTITPHSLINHSKHNLKEKHDRGQLRAAGFNSDGTTALLLYSNGDILHWGVKTRTLLPHAVCLILINDYGGRFRETIGPDSAFSPDASRVCWAVAGQSADGEVIHMSDTEDGMLLWSGEHPNRGVGNIMFSPSGEYVLTTSWRGRMRIWRVNDGSHIEKMVKMVDPGRRHQAVFSTDGVLLVISGRFQGRLSNSFYRMYDVLQKFGHI